MAASYVVPRRYPFGSLRLHRYMSLLQAAVLRSPAIRPPLLDARLANTIDLHVARAGDRAKKWSVLAPRVAKVVNDAIAAVADVDPRLLNAKDARAITWYGTPEPISRAVVPVPKDPAPASQASCLRYFIWQTSFFCVTLVFKLLPEVVSQCAPQTA